ncbi:D-alanyl-D-alanine carboxypeptidase [Nocardioides terrae]|uniref:D-alanyl-D-alanine carboxypeptidase n=1 Tax=Nocardioides terrae TaxID=574651 RepID=A0A1I1GX34_9ACTN|nr:M15 family metallopeptidase [Nocardioides terrae]SFC15852.1 D-alanyl-D-alanine carboxypeptidase [Nocardioides terrae]
MTSRRPAPRATRRTRTTVPVLATVAAFVALAACGSAIHSSGREATPIVTGTSAQRVIPGDPPGRLHDSRLHRLGTADGKVPDVVSVFDDDYPAVTKLDPALLAALREAAEDAGTDGVTFNVNSGWRSDRYQEQLFDQAVSEYGSEAKASQWVARPGTSVHEAGQAVDLGPDDADEWLSRHGATYGLCQTYRNEPWHYELRPDAVDDGCPAPYADPTQDPRMRP